MTDWQYFYGNRKPAPIESIADRPPWREFMSVDRFTEKQQDTLDGKSWQDLSEERWTALRDENRLDSRSRERGRSFRIRQEEGESRYSDIVRAVNSALNLRRPLLVTGTPGSGKTSLAYAIAYELGLGSVLQWPVTARSKLQDALYRYDAIARLQDTQFDKSELELMLIAQREEGDLDDLDREKFEKLKRGRDLGSYIQLGAVGTAFLPSHLPRVLLLDEIDKSDLTLPNDLLNLFEEGQFEIDELVRQKDGRAVEVRTADDGLPARIVNGRVTCHEFPLIVMTSNGERDFPPAFLRRCLRVEMPRPQEQELGAIVRAHFDPEGSTENWDENAQHVSAAIAKFSEKLKASKKSADLATDQLLNLVYMAQQSQRSTTESVTDEEWAKEFDEIAKILLKSLTQADGK
ncbi:MAG: AAA family ATPase [Coleofasciculaceae cyanobacterium RL_1_1]|nr:AAA family ATPase [Coleofasciculaceae cyanobacterium RL_1_1]